MAIYVGEAVKIIAQALDPETDAALSPPPDSAVVDFWAPGRNPIKDTTVRDTPDVANQTMTYRTATSDFELVQPTQGAPWTAGKWTYRVTMVGAAFPNWEYFQFKLQV